MKSKVIKKLKQNEVKFENLNFLAGDASERKYFTIQQGKELNVLMFDENLENLNKFIKILNCLKGFVSVPKIFNDKRNSGILILENFGNNKFSQIISHEKQLELYKVAVDALIHLHKNNPNVIVPHYNTATFLEESNLFFEWFLKNPSEDVITLKDEFNSIFKEYLIKTSMIPKVFIHRDYHVDNLFYLKGNKNHLRCGWIDFQDAVTGPCVYDLVSLTQDARVDVDKKVEDFIIRYYLDMFKDIDKKNFIFSYKVIAIQRHLKVLGIFSRLAKRDKKKGYLKHLPRVLRLLKNNLKSLAFKPLNQILKNLLDVQ